ncbi:DUF4113 domain-containing protein [Vreelandella sulfidaeris]
MAAMDALNEKMGKGTVRLWLREKHEPDTYAACTGARYTTNWGELIRCMRMKGTAKRSKL